MTVDDCAEMRLLVQADVDGELRPAEAARVSAHVDRCPHCAELQSRLLALSSRLERDAPRYAMPASGRARVQALIRAGHPSAAPAPAPSRWPPRLSRRTAASFGAGFAAAACMALFLLLPPSGAADADAVVAAHIRALQPGHLMDVASTDQHTVKPWFDGRLPFAPPVKDPVAAGFPLAGGRLDYLAGHPAAAMVYRRGQHVINLFAWPGEAATGEASGARDGYNFQRWSEAGMRFWAVSDLNPADLAAFVRDWRALP